MKSAKMINWTKRILAVLLVIASLMSNVSCVSITAFAETNSANIEMTEYSSDLFIYNVNFYTGSDGSIIQSAAQQYAISGTTTLNIDIGDDPNGADDTVPLQEDIPLELHGLTVNEGGVMTVRQVYSGANCVRMTVTADSAVHTLNVSDNAVLQITLNSDFAITNLSLGAGSTLNVDTNGHNLTVDGLSGSGSVSITGSGTVNAKTIYAQTLSVTDASVSADSISAAGDLTLVSAKLDGKETGMITAGGNISISGGSVSNAALFGVAESATGSRTVTFANGSTFHKVTAVGVANACTATVSFVGEETIASSADTNFVRDYSISYYYGSTQIQAQDTWPVSYRVRHSGSVSGTGTILGSTNSLGVYTAGSTVDLPEYDQPGYTYDGWMLNDTKLETLTDETGDLKLTAQMVAGAVLITYDLDYEPSASTNDLPLPSKQTTQASSLDSALTLPVPNRFGYIFKGWKVTTGSAKAVLQGAYTVSLDDLTEDADGAYTLNLTAQWEKDVFPIRLTMGSGVPVDYVEIQTDAESDTWVKITELSKNGVTWDAESKSLSFTESITYGETLEAYFQRVLGVYPVLRDSRTENTQSFSGWTTANGTMIDAELAYTLDDSFLDGQGEMTLVVYQDYLKSNPVSLISYWGATENKLTTDTISGWTILVNDVEKTPDSNGQIPVLTGSTVTYRCLSSVTTGFSRWSLARVIGTSLNYSVSVTERVETIGDATYLCYDFTMPASDVAASYGFKRTAQKGTDLLQSLGGQVATTAGKMPIDLYVSDIIFDLDVAYNGIAMDGFWYSADMNIMTPRFYDADKKAYFYPWDFGDDFYIVTSQPTENQVKLVDKLEVYFEDVTMLAREEYSKAFSGYYFTDENGVSYPLESMNFTTYADIDISSYANIIIDCSLVKNYKPTLYFLGENTVGAIMSNNYKNTTEYNSSAIIHGQKTGKLALGLYFNRNGSEIYSIEISEYNNTEHPDNSAYIFYYGGTQYIRGATVNAPNKKNYGAVQISEWGSMQSNVTFRLQQGGFTLAQSAYFHVMGDLYTSYSGGNSSIKNNASMVVDGNMIGSWHNTMAMTVDTTGYFIVKGNHANINRLAMKNGTLICNNLLMNMGIDQTGGTIIANLISNKTYASVVRNNDATVTYTYDNPSFSKITGYPFTTYAITYQVPDGFTFSGGEVYLLGYYPEPTAEGYYDMTVTAMSADNPIRAVIEQTMEDGSADTENILQTGVAENECILYGNSNYTADTQRSRYFAVSGGSLYAAGNLTFFNDTTISSGTVECGGDLSSLLDLIISGGTIKADQVGNAGNETVTSGGLTRWAGTYLSGEAAITANRLGALSAADRYAVQPRSAVMLTDFAGTLATAGGGEVTLVNDVYVNYLGDTGVYDIPTDNPQTLHYEGSILHGEYQGSSLVPEQEMILTLPTVLSDSSKANWRYDVLSGPVVDRISQKGCLMNGSALVEDAAYKLDKLILNAAQSKAKLNLKAGDSEITSVTADGTDVTWENGAATVSVDDTIVLTLDDPAMVHKTVICYKDASGVLHNVESVLDDSAGTVTFTMPAADPEIWVTEEFSLYLNEYAITFTADGFKAGSEAFHYLGNLLVTQSNVYDTRVNLDENGYPVKTTASGNNVLEVQPAEGAAWTAMSAHQTANQMYFESGSGNANSSFARKITLEHIVQTAPNLQYGTIIADGEQVELTVRGTVRLSMVQTPYDAALTIRGDTDSSGNVDDYVCTTYNGNNIAYAALAGTAEGDAAGDVTLENLFIVKQVETSGGVARSYETKTDKTALFKNCIIKNQYAMNDLVDGYATVKWEDTTCDIKFTGSHTTRFLTDVDTFEMENSVFKVVSVGPANYNGHLPLGTTQYIDLYDSSFDFSVALSEEGINRYNGQSAAKTGQEITLRGASAWNVDYRFMAYNKMVVTDNASVTVGSEGKPGYLFCSSLEVSKNASVTADYIFLSGFFVTKNGFGGETEELILEYLKNDSNVRDGWKYEGLTNGGKYEGLTIQDNATVTAAEFVGGDKNSTITMDGGTLNAKAIGTYGALVGYPTKLPTAAGPFIVEYRKTPVGITVDLNGGTVNVLEDGYLGGVNAQVQVNGATVNLADGAVIGLSQSLLEEAKQNAANKGYDLEDLVNVEIASGTVTGTGSIIVPYGSVTISGSTTAVDVYDLHSEEGTIVIRQANGQLDNPSNISDKLHDRVGVRVSNLLEAQNVYILDGAVVYAMQANSNTPAGETGALTVGDNSGAPAYLYVDGSYGSVGEVDSTISVASDGSAIFGSQRYSITYVMNDDAEDRAVNDPFNPSSYQYGSGTVKLYEPTRFGYDFAGWYDNEDLSGDPLTSLITAAKVDRTLYAKWVPKTVTFVITVSTQTVANLAEEYIPEQGTYDAATGIYTYSKQVDVPYRQVIIGTGEDQLQLTNYGLKTLQVLEVRPNDAYYTTTNALVSGNSTVTKAILKAYEKKVTEQGDKAALELTVALTGKSLFKQTFDLNLNAADRPIDAAFGTTVSTPYTQTATTIEEYVNVGDSLSSVGGLTQAAGVLVEAAAQGYTFAGWCADKECTQDPVTADQLVSQEQIYYAKWIKNPYNITFDAGTDGQVTRLQSEPGSADLQTKTGTVLYDTVIDGNLTIDGVENSKLPYAWKPGYVFVGWSVNGTDVIPALAEFNLSTFQNAELLDNASALTLTAVYRQATVTYHTNNGQWTNGIYTTTPYSVSLAYGEPLAGYTDTGSAYEIISTTAEQFAENSTYVTNDYRYTIQRKGYTFTGWVDSEGVSYTSAPKYADIELTAQWAENQYTLTLNSPSERNTYAAYLPDTQGEDAITASVVVGETIEAGSSGVSVDNWPSRLANQWYAYDKTISDALQENEKRYLLGFTFDPLDPGTTDDTNTTGHSVYEKYADDVIYLINSGNLFVKGESSSEGTIEGSVFQLPADGDYGPTKINDAKTVPDYPNGSTIQMYAVYRERSLVFVEYVKTENGTDEKVLHSAPVDSWSDFPFAAVGGYAEKGNEAALNAAGYALVGWYVNGTNLNSAAQYPDNAEDYADDLSEFKTKAEALGTIDVLVYTVYAAQTVVKNVTLTAKSDPTTTEKSVFTYKLPGSIQSGVLHYEFSDLQGLTLVDGSAMDQYDSSVSDNTVGILAELINATGEVKESLWLTGAGGSVSETAVSAGWQIRLTLFHSNVMTANGEYSFDLKFTFDKLPDQHITFEDMQVILVPSEYTVKYQANLPADPSLVIISENGYADSDEDGYVRYHVQSYGSEMLSEVPDIEGYTVTESWIRDMDGKQHSIAFGGDLRMPVQSADLGIIPVYVNWKANEHSLTTEGILDKWTVVYGNTPLTQSGATVPYHTQVTFTPLANGEEPAYVFLKIGEQSYRLDLYATKNSDGSYTFLMPDANVEAVYKTTMDLYLENGTIEITPDGYIQTGPGAAFSGKFINWTGDYRILQNAVDSAEEATTYTLKLSGDLDERTVILGNLNISSEDSITVDDTATLTVGGDVIAKNIQVSESAKLKMQREGSTNKKLSLAPVNGAAAIGGSSGSNGDIELDGFDIYLDLTPEAGAGIGGAASGTGAGSVTIRNSTVTVKETSTASAVYTGTWIGGNGVTSVVLENTQVFKAADSETILGPKIMDGQSVSVKDCEIGTEAVPLTDPIHAENTLTITNSTVYQSLDQGAPIGTEDGGTITVSAGSMIQSKVNMLTELYTGTLLIDDAKSDVTIANTQILEMYHGDVVISDAGAVQANDYNHTHTGSYLLINEKNAAKAALTVTSIQTGASISTKTAELTDVSIAADAVIEPLKDLQIHNLQIADNIVAEVKPANSVTVTLDAIIDSDGTYKQKGGKLSANSVECEELDIILQSVQTQITSNLIAENLTLIDGSVTANVSSGKVGSTCVSGGVTKVIIDGTSVTASMVGALGKHNETFTFVEVSDDAVISGILVQDHYRIHYELDDSNFSLSNLDTVLRTQMQDGTQTVIPAIPDAPAYSGSGTSYFTCWYLKNADMLYALSENAVPGFDNLLPSLLPEHLSWAQDTDPADGTKTLNVYAWMNIRGTAAIKSGRELNDFTADTTEVTVPIGGAWTAKFTTTVAVIQDSQYQVSFETPLPAGTILTLAVMHDRVPKFYWYACSGGEKTVKLSQFTRMGKTNEAPALLTETAGTMVEHSLLLAVDFADADGQLLVKDAEVSLQMLVGESTTWDISSVNYSVEAAPVATLTADEEDVTVAWSGDARLAGQELYLVAKLSEGIAYDAVVSLVSGETVLTGRRLGSDMVAFAIGSSQTVLNTSAALTVSGMDGGTYSIIWQLCTAMPGNGNVLGNVLATATGEITVVAAVKPFLRVSRNSVSTQGIDRVLEAGITHTVSFTVSAHSGAVVSAEVQRQGTLGVFSVFQDIKPVVENDVITVVIPDTLRAGTYRIRFSLDGLTEDSIWDDVYFTLIIA